MIGLNENKDKLYITYIGLSKKSISLNNQHIPFETGKNNLNCMLLFYLYSSRYDLENIGYILLDFIRGNYLLKVLNVNLMKKLEKIGNK